MPIGPANSNGCVVMLSSYQAHEDRSADPAMRTAIYRERGPSGRSSLFSLASRR